MLSADRRLLVVQRRVEERSQSMAAAGMTQFAQRFRLDLPYALTRDREVLANFFQRMFTPVLEPEAHLDDFFLAGAERFQHLGGLLAQIQIDYRFRRRNDAPVDDEVTQVRFLF